MRGAFRFHRPTNNSKWSSCDEKPSPAQNGMEKCTNQVSPEVASNRLSKLLVESTNIAIASFLPVLVQIPLSLAAAQIFFLSKVHSFLPFFLAVSMFRVIWSLDCTSALHSCSCYCSDSRIRDVRYACITTATIISVRGSDSIPLPTTSSVRTLTP
jgi:hypothetical protein